MSVVHIPRSESAERATLTDVLVVLFRQRRTIALCAAGVLGVVTLVTLVSPMKFRAQGSLYLGELQADRPAPGQVPEQLDFLGGRHEHVGTEVEILKSRSLITRAVLASGLNVRLVPQGWGAPRYWRWRLGGRNRALLDRGAAQVLASGAVAGEDAEFTVQFAAGGRYEIGRGKARVGSGRLGAPFRGGGLAITLTAGPEGPPTAGAVFDLEVAPAADIAERAARAVSVSMPRTAGPGEAVKVVAIEYRDASPRATAAFVAALMQAYLDSRQKWKAEEATAAEAIIGGQARAMERELALAEQKLAEFRARTPVVALGEES
jgi:uncharacterized protein involved in exopolysaccharide biosynthesis